MKIKGMTMKLQSHSWLADSITPLVLIGALLMQAGCISSFVDSGTTDPSLWIPVTETADSASPVSYSRAPQRGMRPGDHITVTLQPSLNVVGQRIEDVVDDDGMITLPLIGEFHVLDRVPTEVSKAIAQEYVDRGMYLDMIVNVVNTTALTIAADEYSVTGEVPRRGRFPLKEGMTLWQAIIAAGDVSAYAGDRVLLTRDGRTTRYSIKRIKNGSIPDPVIQNGDIIEVKESSFTDWFR